jgi:hypothetical protein
VALAAVLVSVSAGGVAVVPAYARSYDSSCWASLLTDSKTVHTTSWSGRGADDLGADLAGYTRIHWQVARPRLSSRHVPPDACEYQVVLHLRPQHARRLTLDMAAWARRRETLVNPPHARMLARRDVSGVRYVRATALTPALDIWPGLQPFVAADARWVSQPGYHYAHRGPRWRQMRLDPEHAIAVVSFRTD